ncbi:uncharacterized protein Z520_06968 [Fonsecaea multimorphosa CBS 102226]|uniref:Uncharacterized protein n=1 Tax=Fonsecaea multimorphosa CBS 102226 TaxID=1442371 RepID=A0A0D2IKF8_9EURO|nr:uncharacterized protein Z520_06968 [Fonsecaea multimorphosa CBS 102226]KIX97516.1 hypothetical protein Z520_06968 [Fonsecaea multimorphosa CBS 102226]OAL23477.1 hypothetical protein AYO22_06527 [Fonsecaea multimorphosa]
MLPPPSAAAGTPCPIPPHADVQMPKPKQQQHHNQHHRQFDQDPNPSSPSDDITANIYFTSAFAVPVPGVLKNAKPRRKRHQDGLGFTIHEDNGHTVASRNRYGQGSDNTNGDDDANKDNLLKLGARRRTAISQPPQRPKKRAVIGAASAVLVTSTTGLATAPPENVSGIAQPRVPKRGSASTRLSQGPRRPITNKAEGAPSSSTAEPLSTLPEDTIALPMQDSTTTLKPARRATIYIPNEDTTMPSMYMGIFSPIKNLDMAVKASAGLASTSTTVERSSKPDVELTGIVAQMVAKKRGATEAKNATSLKRMPLQVTTKPLQEGTVVVDRWGQGGGKENIPPGEGAMLGKKAKSGKGLPAVEGRGRDLEVVCPPAQQQDNTQARAWPSYEPKASFSKKVHHEGSSQRACTKPSWNAGSRLRTSRSGRTSLMEKQEPKSSQRKLECEALGKKPSVPSRFVIPKVDLLPVAELYPVIAEDLADPAMYEENWLSHQEIAITQLVNNLFGASAPLTSPVEDEMLKLQLFERYGDPENVMLYKRLQASLLYGALSVSRDVLKGAVRLSNDLGKRKAFTDLWLDTYELPYLGAALEVVVGRRCLSNGTESSSVRPNIDSGHGVNRRTLQQFIEIFLIRNEDGQPDEISTDRHTWSYQRTLLRSLMLIKLLDTTKAATSPSGSSKCLFQPCSSYKTSVDVVQALFQLLNPSAGDPIRALTHIGYMVTHTQHPLAEYSYKMENLAVDLRDGVRLTRLVELLLYPSVSQLELHDPETTSSIILPTGQQLSLTEGDCFWPLSQHLKYPCPGRATKLYNVQIALSAIQGVKGLVPLTEAVKAEDIVDGFREKTVRLLWALTSKWGLGGLVDWNDVEREIKRLCRTGASSCEYDDYDLLSDEDGHARHMVLLKAWAQAIASKEGIRVTNLTTNFSDGRVFQAIVEEYEGYLSHEVGSRQGRSLSDRLRRLGCSEQFAMLFAKTEGSPHYTHIFDRDFVVAALAFLCSRLLNPTKAVRAAITIQRRWRWYWSRVVESRKVHVKAVAESCARMALEKAAAVAANQGKHEVELTVARNEENERADEDIWLSL